MIPGVGGSSPLGHPNYFKWGEYFVSQDKNRPQVHSIPKSVINLKVASDLFEMAFQIKRHQVYLKHPQLPEAEIRRLTMESFEASEKK